MNTAKSGKCLRNISREEPKIKLRIDFMEDWDDCNRKKPFRKITHSETVKIKIKIIFITTSRIILSQMQRMIFNN